MEMSIHFDPLVEMHALLLTLKELRDDESMPGRFLPMICRAIQKAELAKDNDASDVLIADIERRSALGEIK